LNDDFILFLIPQHDGDDVSGAQFIFHDGARLFISGDGVVAQLLHGDDVIVAIIDVFELFLFYFIIFLEELRFFALFLFII
jgi:hypothetical protein